MKLWIVGMLDDAGECVTFSDGPVVLVRLSPAQPAYDVERRYRQRRAKQQPKQERPD